MKAGVRQSARSHLGARSRRWRRRWSGLLTPFLFLGCGPAEDSSEGPFDFVALGRIVGVWEGSLAQVNLRIVVHIADEHGTLTVRFDSPDQNVYGIVADSVAFDSLQLSFSVDSINASYTGTLSDDGSTIQGRWEQSVVLDLDLKRADKHSVQHRKQNPNPPFPYKIEDVVFSGGAPGVTLAGTLTLPAETDEAPVVVLVTGSGAQDRDETIVGHKPFWVLADYLTRQGIGVLRYDDRGFGQSTGNFATATTVDFADDADAAVSYLGSRTEVVASRIGVVGHSEGGNVVSMLAGRAAPIACGVLMAGPAVSGEYIHQRQVRLIIERQSFPISVDLIEKLAAMNRSLYVAARPNVSLDERRSLARDTYRSALRGFDEIERKL